MIWLKLLKLFDHVPSKKVDRMLGNESSATCVLDPWPLVIKAFQSAILDEEVVPQLKGNCSLPHS